MHGRYGNFGEKDEVLCGCGGGGINEAFFKKGIKLCGHAQTEHK